LIRPSVVLATLGKILVIIGLAMATSVLCSLYYHEPVFFRILLATVITNICGVILWFGCGDSGELNYKEVFVVVTVGWLGACLFCTLPFALSGYFASFADSFFEATSGITTTGATVLTDIEVLPRGLLFWRSLTQWLGGMGIMVLFIALIQVVGIRANQIYRAEIAGGTMFGKISPKARDTAKIFWISYVALSAVLLVLLWVEGMSLFDAFCHTCTTMATGGFSTRNASIAYYTSPAIQWTILIFMFLAGSNFSLHYFAVSQKDLKVYIQNREWVFYFVFTLIAAALLFLTLGDIPVGEYRIRTALFQVISILTTTGFATEDFGLWTWMPQTILFLLLFTGASAGSTSGNLKMGRYLIMWERIKIEFKKMIHPRAVISQSYGGHVISEGLIVNVFLYFFLHMMFIFIGMMVLGIFDIDLLTSFSAAATCMGNVGPGFGEVGPALNYAFVPAAGKYTLCLLMILGRLEIYPMMVLFFPAFWKRS